MEREENKLANVCNEDLTDRAHKELPMAAGVKGFQVNADQHGVQTKSFSVSSHQLFRAGFPTFPNGTCIWRVIEQKYM